MGSKSTGNFGSADPSGSRSTGQTKSLIQSSSSMRNQRLQKDVASIGTQPTIYSEIASSNKSSQLKLSESRSTIKTGGSKGVGGPQSNEMCDDCQLPKCECACEDYSTLLVSSRSRSGTKSMTRTSE